MAESQSLLSKLAENLLVGTVESIARAGARFLESITDDAEKAIEKQRKKIAATREGVAEWRETQLGNVDNGDLPASLADDDNGNGSNKKKG